LRFGKSDADQEGWKDIASKGSVVESGRLGQLPESMQLKTQNTRAWGYRRPLEHWPRQSELSSNVGASHCDLSLGVKPLLKVKTTIPHES
jgi:hypothetical protein